MRRFWREVAVDAERVVRLDDGHVVQQGPITELTARPRSRYIAELVGLNLISGIAHDHEVTVAGDDPASSATITVADPNEGEVFLLIHPHAVALHPSEPSGSPRNRWPARIEELDLLGERVRVRLAGPVPLVAEVTAGAVAALCTVARNCFLLPITIMSKNKKKLQVS